MVLEEIVVTAEKRQANLQDVPVAISAFTSETRDLLGITNIQDLTDFTPGLSYASTLDRMSLRGVGRLTNNYGSDPGIATYSDGFYTASNVEAGKRPIHTERVEVLRGPQGTLYGRNSIGGALNVISKRPTDTFQAEMRATAGNYDTQIYEGSVSGPITDWLRYRVAGNAGGQNEGFFKDANSNETEGGQNDDMYVDAQLAFNIGEIDGRLDQVLQVRVGPGAPRRPPHHAVRHRADLLRRAGRADRRSCSRTSPSASRARTRR